MEAELIKSLVKDADRYEAHIRPGRNSGTIRESLLEHTELTLKYFRKLWEEKQVKDMVERFFGRIRSGAAKDAELFLEEMIWGIPVFHDLGKINPDFQRRKLSNDRITETSVFTCVVGRHSLISAVLYMDYFLGRLRNAAEDKEDRKVLKRLILLHAYIIGRHHSDLDTFERFSRSMEEEAGSDLIDLFSAGKCMAWKHTFTLHGKKVRSILKEFSEYEAASREECIGTYVYVKMLYSLLVASDYYATAEFMAGAEVGQFGNLDNAAEWLEIYENTELMKKIRMYQRERYPRPVDELQEEKDINQLRTEMLCDAEKALKEHINESLFYLEAPTGSGKSNTALNLSFRMMEEDSRLRKIYYIYPFNTLVEQNMDSLKKIFGENPDIFDNITVVNSLVPIKMTQKAKAKEKESESELYYQKALLDRQFLNYPMIVSTHVSLFDTMFGNTKESAFGVHQLMNSIIVLDEIQSYKNTLWGEIICFLKEFSYLLNMKVIIMSATLPNLDALSENTYQAVTLLQEKEKYFSNPCFKNRVRISYELLGASDTENTLAAHIGNAAAKGRKVLVEFIKKDTAYRFFERLKADEGIGCDVEYMSGDDSLMERSRILNKIKKEKGPIILVATQVVEAGVDIDMDIGYKNISKLDSEEQFLGRINRSCLRTGEVYFFKADEAKRIYRNDIRAEKEFTLEEQTMRRYLESKNFCEYYRQILNVLKKNYNDQVGSVGLHDFFFNEVGGLNWMAVKERMQLISEGNWSMSVYLSRILEDENGEILDGRKIWNEYSRLLKDFQMSYARKKVELSRITSRMNYFIYQIKRNDDLIYNDKIGELFFIEDGEKYFENGKLNRKKIQGEIGEFVDFI